MKKIILILITLAVIASCRKEEFDNFERPAPWVRYSMEDLADTATNSLQNSFGVFILSVSGLHEYKIWVDDSLTAHWTVEDELSAVSDGWSKVDVNFSEDVPSTKHIIVWAKDRAGKQVNDTLSVKYKGGTPDRGTIVYNPNLIYGSIYASGSNYKTIQIGQLTWLARNIAIVPPSGFYCSAWQEYDHIYGYLYDWQAAVSVNQVSGYALASKQDWQQLITYAGGANSGGALKEKGYNHWWMPNAGATNNTGFTALPASDGNVTTLLTRGYYWTSTEEGSDSAWAVKLCFENAMVEFILLHKNALASVRLKNTSITTVQDMLNAGKTPQELITLGFPLDSIYGKFYKGGYIFYHEPSNGGGLVAAPYDQAADVQWCNTLDTVYAWGTGYFTGISNTNLIVSQCATVGTAAEICSSLSLGGFTDWYLPSLNEATAIYQNLITKGYGNFPTFPWKYWTSTENEPIPLYYAFAVYFNGGSVSPELKTDLYNVRAVRAYQQ